jgi:hypothetical protein
MTLPEWRGSAAQGKCILWVMFFAVPVVRDILVACIRELKTG